MSERPFDLEREMRLILNQARTAEPDQLAFSIRNLVRRAQADQRERDNADIHEACRNCGCQMFECESALTED